MPDSKARSYTRTLEEIIDKSSLQDILREIANICERKADHIRENWPAGNSEGLAFTWERAANNVYNAAHSGSVDAVSR